MSCLVSNPPVSKYPLELRGKAPQPTGYKNCIQCTVVVVTKSLRELWGLIWGASFHLWAESRWRNQFFISGWFMCMTQNPARRQGTAPPQVQAISFIGFCQIYAMHEALSSLRHVCPRSCAVFGDNGLWQLRQLCKQLCVCVCVSSSRLHRSRPYWSPS